WAPVPPPHAAARPRNLPWAPVPTPHAAARPVICHGPLYRLLMLLPGPECLIGSLYGPPIAAVSIATLCHVPLSGLLTTAGGFHFVIGCCMAIPIFIAAASTATLWPNTLVLGLVTAQMSEVCGDSKINGTHLHVILTDSIIFFLPADSKGILKLRVPVFCT
ncbi:unnamed protein product, partial [Staurois parvus]